MKKSSSGTIVWVDLGTAPYGHEQSGLRPAVLLSVQNAIAVVIPITTNTASLRFTATLPIIPDKTNGLGITSIALVFQIRAVDVRRITKTIGILSKKDTRAVNKITHAITSIR